METVDPDQPRRGDQRAVVADFEAGIGTLSRMAPGDLEALLIVVEPTAKSIEVGRRAAGLARERSLGNVVIVANRVRDEADLEQIRAAFPEGQAVIAVPEDPAVIDADRRGVAPLDLAPRSPAVEALTTLAERLADEVGV